MIRLIHVSDLHFGADFVLPIPGHKRALQKLLTALSRAMEPEPDIMKLLLITGDIVDDGTAGEYEEAAAALEPFARRTLIVPGNHDYGREGLAFNPRSVERMEALCEHLRMPRSLMNPEGRHYADRHPHLSLHEDGLGARLLVVALNSCSEQGLKDGGEGELGSRQLQDLDRELGRKLWKGIPTLILLHHDPYCGVEGRRLRDSEELMRILRPHAPQAILYGHKGVPLQQAPQGRQGRRIPPERKAEMKVRPASRGRWSYLRLDANASVRNCAWFEIEVDDKGIRKPVVRTASHAPASASAARNWG